MNDGSICVTQPLGYKKYLQTKPQPGFDSVPVLDMLFILLLIGLNFSQFIMTPGALIDLAKTEVTQSSITAPTAVLTVGRNELYFFEGYKVSPSGLQAYLETYVQSLGNHDNVVLLIKADKRLSAEILFGLFESARNAGFSHVQLAAELSDTFNSTWKAKGRGFEE